MKTKNKQQLLLIMAVATLSSVMIFQNTEAYALVVAPPYSAGTVTTNSLYDSGSYNLSTGSEYAYAAPDPNFKRGSAGVYMWLNGFSASAGQHIRLIVTANVHGQLHAAGGTGDFSELFVHDQVCQGNNPGSTCNEPTVTSGSDTLYGTSISVGTFNISASPSGNTVWLIPTTGTYSLMLHTHADTYIGNGDYADASAAHGYGITNGQIDYYIF